MSVSTAAVPQTHRKPFRLLTLLVVLLLAVLLAGCGQREAEEAAEPRGPTILPRLTISVDEQGTPQIPLLQTAARLMNIDTSAYRVPPELVQQMMAADVQHVEAVAMQDGLLLYVNGQPMPYLALDEQSRGNIGQLLTLANVSNPDRIQRLLDMILSRVGLPVALKFPMQAGAAEIPLRERRALDPVDINQVRESTGPAPLVAYVDVAVDANGVPTIAGSSMTEFQEAFQAAGIPVDLSTAKLDPATVAGLTANNIQLLQVETEPEGLYLYLNGQKLPRIAWDDARLQNAVDLLEKMQPDNPNLPLMQFLLPYLQPTDLELSVYLPKQAGAQDATPAPFVQ